VTSFAFLRISDWQRVVADHSFDARAGELLDAALTVVPSRHLDSRP
jgi:hypothetical protein